MACILSGTKLIARNRLTSSHAPLVTRPHMRAEPARASGVRLLLAAVCLYATVPAASGRDSACAASGTLPRQHATDVPTNLPAVVAFPGEPHDYQKFRGARVRVVAPDDIECVELATNASVPLTLQLRQLDWATTASDDNACSYGRFAIVGRLPPDGLAPHTAYIVKTRRWNGHGHADSGAPRDTWTFTTGAGPAPLPPVGAPLGAIRGRVATHYREYHATRLSSIHEGPIPAAVASLDVDVTDAVFAPWRSSLLVVTVVDGALTRHAGGLAVTGRFSARLVTSCEPPSEFYITAAGYGWDISSSDLQRGVHRARFVALLFTGVGQGEGGTSASLQWRTSAVSVPLRCHFTNVGSFFHSLVGLVWPLVLAPDPSPFDVSSGALKFWWDRAAVALRCYELRGELRIRWAERDWPDWGAYFGHSHRDIAAFTTMEERPLRPDDTLYRLRQFRIDGVHHPAAPSCPFDFTNSGTSASHRMRGDTGYGGCPRVLEGGSWLCRHWADVARLKVEFGVDWDLLADPELQIEHA